MSERKTQFSAERLLGLVLAVALASVGLWALIRFGPRPVREQADAAPPAQSASAQEAAPPDGLPSTPRLTNAADDAGKFFNFFSMGGQLVGQGRESGSVREFLDGLEARYKQRGYRVMDSGASSKKRGASGTPKVYWRSEYEDVALIGAVGEDANPISESHAETGMYATIITPDAGGLRWVTYCYDTASRAAATDFEKSGSDLFGEDPSGVPRPPGLQRVLSFENPDAPGSLVVLYTSRESPHALRQWYQSEMKRNWRLEQLASTEAAQLLPGMLCFTSGSRLCMIWIDGDESHGLTTVIISSRNR
jgi:hypothetical protein